jgi:hypothetical protein
MLLNSSLVVNYWSQAAINNNSLDQLFKHVEEAAII